MSQELPGERDTDAGTNGARTSIALYVCTFRRNGLLARLLDSVIVAAATVADQADVAVVIVDDDPDGGAQLVAERYAAAFELGTHYVHSGAKNISVARNLGLETASKLADWVAMTDDDCEVTPQWFAELLRVQRATGADALTGPHVRTAPPDAPRWLRDHPFLINEGGTYPDDGEEPENGQTNNSMIRAAFVQQHPEVRFDPALGGIGGEDMVFYHQARAAGLRLTFARQAIVHEEAEGARLTLRYYLWAALWFGNTMYVTSARNAGLGPVRGILRSLKRLAAAVVRPFGRLARRQPPELVYTLSLVLSAVGHLLGVFGVRIPHRS